MNEKAKLERLTDFLVEDILEASPEEILAEFEEDEPGGAERHVTEMRALVEKAVAKANEDRPVSRKDLEEYGFR